ncbi:MAG: VWA domain-containing protein [Selenomonadaceae bacterium]|nr:VWA domain-containing protein [Selenomonadaceae bacterium]
MKKFGLQGLFAALALWLIISWPSVAFGQEVVFLMDISRSLRDTDKLHAVPESIRAMVLGLNDEDKAGIIAFDTEPWELMPLTTVRGATLPDLFNQPYDGYTNTGLALQKALNMLEGAEAGRVVIVTDGEVRLASSSATLHASQLFAAGMEEASRRHIPVYILALNTGTEEEDFRLHNGYAKVSSVAPQELWLAARKLLWEELGARGLELGGATFPEGGDGQKKLTATFPNVGVRSVKFLITSSKAGAAALTGEAMVAASQSHEFRLNAPEKGELALDIDYPVGTQVLVDAFPEMDGKLIGRVETNWQSPEATLHITPVTEEGQPLLNADQFLGRKVRLTVNDAVHEATVAEGGVITLTLPEGQRGELTVKDIRFDDLGVRYMGMNFLRLDQTYRHWWPWALVALGAIILGAFLYRSSRRPPSEKMDAVKPPAQPPNTQADKKEKPHTAASLLSAFEKKQVGYLGKLVFRITRSRDGSDSEPREYNLFRRSKGEDISLAEVIKACGIERNFPGAADIIFSPLPGGLVVLNRSSCTITHRCDIVLQGAGAELSFGDSLHIAFSDEASELILTYKSLKPDEE